MEAENERNNTCHCNIYAVAGLFIWRSTSQWIKGKHDGKSWSDLCLGFYTICRNEKDKYDFDQLLK